MRNALEKDGWTITHDPLYLIFKNTALLIDLGAERMLAAEKEGQKIAVEIKDFDCESVANELQKTMGQLQLYRWALDEIDPERILYLAVSAKAHAKLHEDPLFQTVVERSKINLMILDSTWEVITQWIKR